MIYLDNAATAFPTDAALAAFEAEARLGANPSSMHAAGFAAHRRLEEYRRTLAETIGALPEEICFTAGGTESANLALLGTARTLSRRGKRILVSDAEHPCVSECTKALAAEGFEVLTIPTKGGVLDLDALRDAANEQVILAAFMLVNNETGAVFDVRGAFDVVHAASKSAYCFCDAVQAHLKVPFTVKELGCDLLSLSAHKIGGVRGIGALYVRKGVRLISPLHGGGQEKGLRSGTENTPAIAAYAAAAKEGYDSLPARCKTLQDLKERLSGKLAALEGVTVLEGFAQSPHIVSASFEKYKSEVLLHLLSDAGVSVSAGSACSSKKGAKSPILLAHGLSAARADSTLRFSLSTDTRPEEIDEAVRALQTILTQGRYSR